MSAVDPVRISSLHEHGTDEQSTLDLSISSAGGDDVGTPTGMQRFGYLLSRLVHGDVPHTELQWIDRMRIAVETADLTAMTKLSHGGVRGGWMVQHAPMLMTLAVRRRQLRSLDFFIQSAAALNKPDSSRVRHKARSPLQEAARRGWFEGVDALLTAGAVPDRPDTQGCTPLHHAVRCGYSAIVQRLLTAGADANGHGAAPSRPLHNAATVDMLELLLKHGASASLANGLGATALHEQARWGRLGCVHLLLRHGKDAERRGDPAGAVHVNAIDQYGRTPLFYLGKHGNALSVLQALMLAGADARVRDRSGNVCVHAWCAAVHDQRLFAEILARDPALLLRQNSVGKTAADLLDVRGFTDIVARARAMRCAPPTEAGVVDLMGRSR